MQPDNRCERTSALCRGGWSEYSRHKLVAGKLDRKTIKNLRLCMDKGNKTEWLESYKKNTSYGPSLALTLTNFTA